MNRFEKGLLAVFFWSACTVGGFAFADESVPASLIYNERTNPPPVEVVERELQRWHDIHERITPLVHKGLEDFDGTGAARSSAIWDGDEGVALADLLNPTALGIRIELTNALFQMEERFAICRLCNRRAQGENLPSEVVNALEGDASGGGAGISCEEPPGSGFSCDWVYANAMSLCERIKQEPCPFIIKKQCEAAKEYAYTICSYAASCQEDCCEDGCSGTTCLAWVEGGYQGPKCDPPCS